MPADQRASPPPENVTDLLRAYSSGDGEALERLTRLVYDDLRQIAHHQLARERPGHTLQTTGLAHEAFLKFLDMERIRLEDRTHFLALSARLMRQILVDYARRRAALKRNRVPGASPAGADPAEHRPLDVEGLIDLDGALRRLAETSSRQSRVVECRFFGGMTVEETGEALGISPATVKREWRLARAWLNRELSGAPR